MSEKPRTFRDALMSGEKVTLPPGTLDAIGLWVKSQEDQEDRGGVLAFHELFGEMDDWPRSLRDATHLHPEKVLVRLWCAEHKVIVAAVFATTRGPMLVSSNVPYHRGDRHAVDADLDRTNVELTAAGKPPMTLGWASRSIGTVGTLDLDDPPPLYCPKCRATREVDGLTEMTALALTTHHVERHV